MFQQLEESGCQGVLDTLAEVCAELERTRAQRKEALATLQAKKERIDEFAKTTVSTAPYKARAITGAGEWEVGSCFVGVGGQLKCALLKL